MFWQKSLCFAFVFIWFIIVPLFSLLEWRANFIWGGGGRSAWTWGRGGGGVVVVMFSILCVIRENILFSQLEPLRGFSN